jgi:hypothetical protein
MLTETDGLREMLDRAAILWPEISADRGALLRRLLEELGPLVVGQTESRRTRRLTAIRETSGMFEGLYPPGEAQRLKEEWPE